MSTGIFFLIQSMFYIVLLTITYYSKKRLNSDENKVYSALIIIALIETICEIVLDFVGPLYKRIPLLSYFIARLYLILIIVWLTCFIIYIILVANKMKNGKSMLKTYHKIFSFVIFVVSILIMTLPIYFYYEQNVSYTYGASVKVVYLLSITYSIIGSLVLLFNIKKVIDYRFMPLLIFLVLGGICGMVQMKYPSLLLATSVHVFITFLMYFTIENPDLKMLNKLELAYNEVENSNQVKSDFLSSMTHEINTPLNTIMGFSQLMDEAKTLKEAKENSKYVLDASFTLHNMLKNAIDLIGIEKNNLSIELEKYDLEKEVNELVNLYKKRVIDKKLKLNVKIDVPKILYGDRKKVRRIIANLLDNAIKYTNKGSINLTINSKKIGAKCEIEIIVKDTGVGIDKETQKHLFEYFEREKKYVNGNISGMGLGLSIVKGLVILLDGKIKCNSNEKGTTFNIKICQEG